MDKFTINDIENLTGIKAHTLRIWEKRYKLHTPKRKESNHRYYDNEDLKHILKIAYLYHNGYKISRIAEMENEELNKLTFASLENKDAQLFIHDLLNAAFEFDEDRFEDILCHAIERLGFEQCMVSVVYPYFEKVGLLWMSDKAIPAQEHFSSNIIRSKLIVAIDKLKNYVPQQHRTTLLFMPEGEHHEIPLLFISYLLKKNNKHFLYAGTNIALHELESFCRVKKIDSLYFHLITNFTKQCADDYIDSLAHAFPQQQIVMSGPLTAQVSEKFNNVILLKSLDEAISYAKSH